MGLVPPYARSPNHRVNASSMRGKLLSLTRPMTNLHRSMLDTVGVRTEKVGDSTGKLDALFARA